MYIKMILAWLWSVTPATAKATAEKTLFDKVADKVVVLLGKVMWKSKRVLSEQDFAELKTLLEKDYYIILTLHRGYLSSWAIAIAHFFLRGKFGYYSHVLMNLEDTVKSDVDYRFIEATRLGTQYSGFDHVFNPQTSAVALIKPKSMTLDQWTAVMDRAKTYLGRPYDTLFDLANDNKLSCVELVRDALKAEPNYDRDFANFEAMISSAKNLDPQFYYECPDFEVVWEKRA
jgi:hypothetical protein